MLSLSQNSASLPVTKAKVKVHTTPDEDSGGTGEAPAEDEPPVQKESPANSEISQPEDVSFPKIFKEEQITFEHIMKTFGLDKPPKNLPCPYVYFIFYFPFLVKYFMYLFKIKWFQMFQNYRNLLYENVILVSLVIHSQR